MDQFRALILVVAFAFAGCGEATAGPAATPHEVNVPALLESMLVNFEGQIERIEVDGDSNSITVEIYTTLHPKLSNAQRAKGMAMIASQSDEIRGRYPSVNVEVRIWPAHAEWYMVRVTTQFTDGSITARDFYVNSALR